MSRRRSIVSVALTAAAMTLAACGDAATAPKAAAHAGDVQSPNGTLVVGGGGVPRVAAFLTIKIVDVNDNKLTEPMKLHVVSYPGPIAYVDVTDNDANDLDPTMGIVKVAIAKGTAYEACESGLTTHYVYEASNPTYPRCRYVESTATNVDMGKVYARGRPVITWYTKDEFGNLIWPATLQVSISNWTGSITDGDGIMDGGPFGSINFSLQYEAPVSWCETKAPSKYAAILNKCGSFTAKYEHAYVFTIVHEKLIY